MYYVVVLFKIDVVV